MGRRCNELSPDSARGIFPGFTYQLGNFFASKNGTIQTTLGVSFGNNYGLALAIAAAVVAVAVAVVTSLGPEAHGVEFGGVEKDLIKRKKRFNHRLRHLAVI